jgi:hypothetical protein
VQISNHNVLISQPVIRVSAAFTRPADAVAYAVNDAVADSTSAPTILTFAGMGRTAGSGGMIRKVQLLTDQATNVAQFRLHLFNVPVAPLADNIPYASLYSHRASRVGFVDFPASETEGAGSTQAFSQWLKGSLFYVCDPADTALYGLLETKTAFTPASGQNFYIALSAEQF